MSALLIYEMVPEDTKLFLLPDDVAEEYRAYLEEAQGMYLNSDHENEGMRVICAAIGEEADAPDEYVKFAGEFRKYEKSKLSSINNANISKVYLTGFVM